MEMFFLGISVILTLISIISLILILSMKNKMKESIQTAIQEDAQKNQQTTYQQFNDLSDRIDRKILDVVERNQNFERATQKSLSDFNHLLTRNLTESFEKQQIVIEKRLNQIDNKVNESLNDGFEKTNKTFTSIVERLSKIDEAQKKIDALSVEIVSLQDVLTDKSARGAFGEVQLNQILASIFGEKNDNVYQTQYTFGTNKRADAVLFTPEPLGTIVIDSKFPLETYRRIIEVHPSDPQYPILKRQFQADLKKHIDDISSKYIIPDVTSDQAMMFIPAEAIFAYINAYHPEIIEYSQKNRVWIVSPTTLMSTLTTIQVILMNMERDKFAQEIAIELEKLGIEFERYSERWTKLSNSIDNISKNAKDVHITTEKITKRFESIKNVESAAFDEIE